MPGSRILVLNTGSGNISIIDPARDEVVGTIGVGADPRDMVFAPSHGRVFVTLARAGEVAALDVGERLILGRTKVGEGPGQSYGQKLVTA